MDQYYEDEQLELFYSHKFLEQIEYAGPFHQLNNHQQLKYQNQNDESANNIVLESAADGVLDSPEELKPADDIEGMAS